MAQQTIKFTIRQDGTVTEEVMGLVGNDCENLTKRIEERLWGSRKSRTQTRILRAKTNH